MGNLNTQHALEAQWGMSLDALLAQQFARFYSVKNVAISLDVAPQTITNWLYQTAQHRSDLHGLTPRAIGLALSHANEQTDPGDNRE